MSDGADSRQKWAITLLLFFFMMINFADKAIIGLAGVPIMADLELTPEQFGLVGSSFFFLFSISAVVTGFIVDRVQSRWALLVMGFIWALVQFPMVGKVGIELLIASRIILGAAEGPAYPMALHAAYKWFPEDKRAMPGAFIAQGSSLGVILCIPVLNWIIVTYNWHYAFGALGVAGLLWTIAWLFIGKEGTVGSAPAGTVSQAPRKHSYRRLILNPTNLASWGLYFGAYFSLALGLAWFTPFLVQGLGFGQSMAGKLTALPFIVSAVIIMIGSYFAQRALQRGASSRAALGIFPSLMACAGGVVFIASTFVSDTTIRIALMVTGATLPTIVYTLVPVILAEITPSAQRGAILGLSGAVGTSAGIFAPTIMGMVLGHAATPIEGFNLGYQICGIVTIVGGLIGLIFLQPERQRSRLAQIELETQPSLA